MANRVSDLNKFNEYVITNESGDIVGIIRETSVYSWTNDSTTKEFRVVIGGDVKNSKLFKTLEQAQEFARGI